MSIGIYAFLRIYFLSFGLSAFAQFRTHCPPSSAADGTICPAWPVWYRVQTGAACPASGRVCRALCGTPWFWRGLLCCLRCAEVCPGALWLVTPPEGHTATAQPRPVSPVTTEKIKKAQKTPTPLSSTPKISRKNKKTPTKGLCSVLYLPYKP